MQSLAHLTTERLTGRLEQLLSDERGILVEFLEHLAELDRRELYLAMGYSSLFAYCTEKLRLSKSAAYRRTTAARLLLKKPELAEYLRDGRLCLTTLVELRDVVDEPGVLERAAGRSEEQVKDLVAALRPRPVLLDVMRRLPARLLPTIVNSDAGAPEPTSPPPPRPREPEPIAEEQWRLAFTVGRDFKDSFEQVKAALSHKIPDGNLAEVLEECMRVTLDTLAKRRRGAEKPRKARRGRARRGRHIPVAVRREVWKRDEGKCAFVGADGKRCGSTHQVEFHHQLPYAKGGEATVDNVRLHCRRHNIYRAEIDYGVEHMARAVTAGGTRSPTTS